MVVAVGDLMDPTKERLEQQGQIAPTPPPATDGADAQGKVESLVKQWKLALASAPYVANGNQRVEAILRGSMRPGAQRVGQIAGDLDRAGAVNAERARTDEKHQADQAGQSRAAEKHRADQSRAAEKHQADQADQARAAEADQANQVRIAEKHRADQSRAAEKHQADQSQTAATTVLTTEQAGQTAANTAQIREGLPAVRANAASAQDKIDSDMALNKARTELAYAQIAHTKAQAGASGEPPSNLAYVTRIFTNVMGMPQDAAVVAANNMLQGSKSLADVQLAVFQQLQSNQILSGRTDAELVELSNEIASSIVQNSDSEFLYGDLMAELSPERQADFKRLSATQQATLAEKMRQRIAERNGGVQ